MKVLLQQEIMVGVQGCTYSHHDVSSVYTSINIDTSDEVEELASDKNNEALNNSLSQ